MKVRRFNPTGLDLFGQFLDSVASGAPFEFPENLLTGADTSEAVEPELVVETRTFADRFQLAEYLNKQFGETGAGDLGADAGLWAWLSLYYFDQLCPDDNGTRRPGERARWIPAVGDFRKYYRHLLAGPYSIFRAHRQNPPAVRALLCTPPHKPGELVEQLSSRQELVTNAAVMEAATSLYVDPKTHRPKVGAAGKGPGSVRRLADVLNQFDMTWDLYSMSAPSVVQMLPGEFKKFQRGL